MLKVKSFTSGWTIREIQIPLVAEDQKEDLSTSIATPVARKSKSSGYSPKDVETLLGKNLCCNVNPYTQCWMCRLTLCETCFGKKKYADSKCFVHLKVAGIEGEHKWGDVED